MKRKSWIAAAMLLFCTVSLFADDPKTPAMDPAMMEAMMKAGTPGDPHRMLDIFAGSWNARTSFWMMPGTPPMTMDGSSEHRWVMGGRYMEQKFSGNFMGQPFEGLGYTGYDNVRKHYWGTWMDNMSTGIMTSTGTLTNAKTFQFAGVMADPMTGKDARVDEKITVVDANQMVLEMWSPGPDGKPYKTMEIVYTRKK